MEQEVVAFLDIAFIFSIGRVDEGYDEMVDAKGWFNDVWDNLSLFVRVVLDWIGWKWELYDMS